MNDSNEFKFVQLRYNTRSAETDIGYPSDYIEEQSGRIVIARPDGVETTIGEFCLTAIDCWSAINDRVPLCEVFEEDYDMDDYYEALFDPELQHFKKKVMRSAKLDEGYYNPTLLIIDRIDIVPEHQGKRFGLIAMRALIRLHQRGALIVATKPYPPQYEDGASFVQAREKAKAFGVADYELSKAAAFAKLRQHFARLGFTRVPGTSYVVRTSERRLPTDEQMLAEPVVIAPAPTVTITQPLASRLMH